MKSMTWESQSGTITLCSQVVLIGGSTRIPYVQNLIEALDFTK